MLLRPAFKILFFIFFSITAFGQTSVTIGTGTALPADHHSGPIYRSTAASAYDFSQYAYLYTAAELSTIAPGAVINKIAWNKTSTGATVGAAKFKIYLKNSSTSAYSVATPFSTLINGATLVYNNNNTTIPATTGFVDFVLSTPFTYTGGGLEIMVDWDISSVSGDPTTGTFSWQKTTADAKILGYANSTTITSSLSPTNNSISNIANTRPVMQFTLNTPLIQCSGTPIGGFVTAPDSVCKSTSFLLGVLGSNTGVTELSYQWQSSIDSITWINVTGGITNSISITQTTSNFYRRIIKCGINADTSDAKKVTTKQFSQCYCIPASTNCNLNDVITNVNFGSLQHASSCSMDGYIDFSDSVAAPLINQSTSVPIAVKVGAGGTEYVALWIDYNQNGVFDANEYTSVGSGNDVTINSMVNIPLGYPTGLTKMRVRARKNLALNNTNPCTAYTYGETEDYLINIQPPLPCSGIQFGGNTVTSNQFVCPLDSATLSVKNATTNVSGLSYQWQFSKDSIAWEDLPGKTDTIIFISQDSTRFYRRSIFCGTNTNYSIPVRVQMQVPRLCYCRPESSNCSVTSNITNVNFAGIVNQSTCSPRGYSNYFGKVDTANVQAGLSIPIKVSTFPLLDLTDYFEVWIDYDHSGTFDSTEYNFLGTLVGVGTINGSIYIPINAITGITAMRVRSKSNQSTIIMGLDACTALPSSETEDYLVNIKAPSSCANNLTTGIINGPVDVCAGFPFTLSNINATDGNIRYAWQSSPDSINWTNINNTNNLLRSIEVSQSSTTYYRLVDSCSLLINAISNIIKVKMKSNVINCHCVPGGSSVCTLGDVIGRITFGSIDTTTYCSPNGYGDFVGGNQTTLVRANSAQPITVKIGCANLNGQWVGVWIDFNQNGIFERSEYTLLGSSCGDAISSFIDIPSNAITGFARMRVRVTADKRINPSDACTQFLNGETEDYKISVTPYTACPVFTWLGIENNVWENPRNWSCSIVPGRYANVVVNSGNVIISSNVTVYSLTVNPAATVTVLPPFNLLVTH